MGHGAGFRLPTGPAPTVAPILAPVREPAAGSGPRPGQGGVPDGQALGGLPDGLAAGGRRGEGGLQGAPQGARGAPQAQGQGGVKGRVVEIKCLIEEINILGDVRKASISSEPSAPFIFVAKRRSGIEMGGTFFYTFVWHRSFSAHMCGGGKHCFSHPPPHPPLLECLKTIYMRLKTQNIEPI